MISPKLNAVPEISACLPQRKQHSFLVFLVLAFTVVLVGPASAERLSAGTLTVVSGSVSLKRPGEEKARPAASGEDVLVGDDIMVGARSVAQVSLADGAFINLFPGALLRINQYAFNPREVRRTARVRLLAGSARLVLYKRLSVDSELSVDTDSATIISSDTGDIAVSVGIAGTTIAALANSVRVRNASQLIVGEITLGENQKTFVKTGAQPGQSVLVTPEERKEYVRDIRRMH